MCAEVFSCQPWVWHSYPATVWCPIFHRSDGGERRWREGKEGGKEHQSSPALVHTSTWMLRLQDRRKETQPCPPRSERDLTQAVSGQGKQSHQFSLLRGSCGSSSSTSNPFLFLLSDKVTQSKNLLTQNRARQVTEHLAVSWASRCLCVYLVSLARDSK